MYILQYDVNLPDHKGGEPYHCKKLKKYMQSNI